MGGSKGACSPGANFKEAPKSSLERFHNANIPYSFVSNAMQCHKKNTLYRIF